MVKKGIIIQARVDSKRLPGKIFKKSPYSYESIVCCCIIANNKII